MLDIILNPREIVANKADKGSAVCSLQTTNELTSQCCKKKLTWMQRSGLRGGRGVGRVTQRVGPGEGGGYRGRSTT